MVCLKARYIAGREIIDAVVDGEIRFKIKENQSFMAGWNLENIRGDFMKHFVTLADASNWIEEMDK